MTPESCGACLNHCGGPGRDRGRDPLHNQITSCLRMAPTAAGSAELPTEEGEACVRAAARLLGDILGPFVLTPCPPPSDRVRPC